MTNKYKLLLLLLLLTSCGAFQTQSIISCSNTKQLISNTNIIMAANTSSESNIMPPEVYPLSRKKVMLIEEAKRLNVDERGSYSSVGWSNRHGSVITPASIPGVYTADRPFYWNTIDVGCRCTIIQLQSSAADDGGSKELLIHSPVGLDAPLINALSKLGRVAHVISPNYEHVKFAYQWAEQYPNAKIWGCPGLMEREPNVRWTGELPFGARPPGFFSTTNTNNSNEEEKEHDDTTKMWDWNELQPLHIDTETNPFTGKAFFNEVIYYHKPSKTLLTTDLYWNYPRGDGVTNGQVIDELIAKGVNVKDINDPNNGDYGTWELSQSVGEIPLGSKLWGKVGMDKLFYPFYMNLMVRNDKRNEFNEIARYITCGNSEWEVETIIPAHGDIVRGKQVCKKVLESHFNIQC